MMVYLTCLHRDSVSLDLMPCEAGVPEPLILQFRMQNILAVGDLTGLNRDRVGLVLVLCPVAALLAYNNQ